MMSTAGHTKGTASAWLPLSRNTCRAQGLLVRSLAAPKLPHWEDQAEIEEDA